MMATRDRPGGHIDAERGQNDLLNSLSLPNRELLLRLRRTNLNLLPILAAVLETRRIGQAARELNLTQPAVSQAIQQLRTIFGDELIVMAGRVPMLTERSAELIGPVKSLLADLDEMLSGARPFDPMVESMTARIVTADYITAILTPQMIEICDALHAPHRIEFVGIDIKRMHDLSQMDLVILPRALSRHLGKTHGSLELLDDRFVCIARAGSSLPETLGADRIRSLPQFKFSMDVHFPSNTHHLLTAAADLENDAAWAFEHYAVLGIAVAESERIAVVPEMLAKWLGRYAPLRIIEIDGEPRKFGLDVVWSPELESQRGHRWLRSLVMRAAQQAQQALGRVGKGVAG
ncbi:DNA-binding transcriptional LysR family regulator [Azospirillum lipoferum]|uniref:LysR family transcriptional regulator n=2 Tax=Azospirillum lipoferum TaxID=193 RepID=A0A5A9G2F8_AZOLI|nr:MULTISPECIES: LysR family transcriptional regulator [Azospirillum]KAA0588447.1 LysR family transcriptional regulator [Azospirillum lipoferum]MCP1615234.1 DNA-binding transcriptional LysR family regulator [Azospirillum lipoferum]MDW5534072.1 LysR family transcriptional regulator [Azospirillum sp. NL1]